MNAPKNKRILWLLNHTTLRDSEVPMLLRLGFEVFVPKLIPFDEANQSASVTYEYDASLTIDGNLLKELNQFNFYAKKWSKSLAQAINQNFDAVILAVFPEMVEAVCSAFDSQIFLRIFGMEGDKTYADRFKTLLSPKVFNQIRKSDRIWMAANIATTIDNEPQWLRKKSLYLPAGLPAEFYLHKDQWRGDVNRVFFVCPRIKSRPYYANIYQNFKKVFGGLPHIIAGAQPIPVNDDPFVTGFVEQEEYIEIFKSSKIMFYHSTEERHLHYHPLEAVIYGQPLIFMSGGVLEFLAKGKLPGCCDTPEEARSKVMRILGGDTVFTQEVISSQKVLLREFDTVYAENCWRERFVPTLQAPRQMQESGQVKRAESKLTHIGIWMHETNPKGFTGEGISRLLAMIVLGAQEHPNLQIHIAAVSWVKQAVMDYMEDLGVDSQRLIFEFVNETPPLLFQVHQWWINRKPRERRHWRVWSRLRAVLRKIRGEVFTRFVLLRPGVGLLTLLLLGIIVLPFAVVLGFLLISVIVLRKILKNLIRLLRIDRLAGAMRGYIEWAKGAILGLAPRAFHYMVNAELKMLAKKVGRDNRFTAWFFAYPNNKYIGHFHSPKIVAVPDIVYMDFPSKYSRESSDLMDNLDVFIKQTVRNADAVITFSEYVKQNQIIKPGYQPQEKVTVVRHAPIETRSLISPREDMDNDELLLLARRHIKNYLRKQTEYRSDQNALYLRPLNLGEIDFLFVSSQSRLHKNHLNLIKAYRILLRERYLNLKLVFTGKFSNEMEEYVKRERLHLDVLSMHYIPPVVHASFYACAKLAVVPTLFEGGFPFVFSEALSVNTPVVLSDIPVTREVLSAEEQKLYCFDPYNTQEMADKIQWALENHTSLLEAQIKTYERMKARTWKDAAEEYLQIFQNTKSGKNKS